MYHRRPVFFRADPTYSACSLQPMTNGKTGYDSMQSCQTSTTCLGNAYTYVCGAEGQPPQLVFDTGGQLTPDAVKCYDCFDSKNQLITGDGEGAVDKQNGACSFQSGSKGRSAYKSVDDCQNAASLKCGWKYACVD